MIVGDDSSPKQKDMRSLVKSDILHLPFQCIASVMMIVQWFPSTFLRFGLEGEFNDVDVQDERFDLVPICQP